MNRRDLLRAGAAAAFGLTAFPFGWSAEPGGKKKKLLVFTRSQTFEHSCLRRGKDGELSLLEKTVTELGEKHGFEATCTKDGRVFIPEELAKYDAFLFQTTGDLTKEGGDKNPPMPADGKKNLLEAIAAGKGFVGCHCASDTFHSGGPQWENAPAAKIDPYIAMLGGEFIRHGAQQKATMSVVDGMFPGFKDLKDFTLNEEWYSLKNFAPDLHVLLVQRTEGMKGLDYERPDFPATWARMHGKGRVFYTSMGHREDVWTNPIFQQILLGGLSWAFTNVDAKIEPNLKAAAPMGDVLPKEQKK
jgi:type 1 glutamine amidotransferase